MKKTIIIFFLGLLEYNGWCQPKFTINYVKDSVQQGAGYFRLLQPVSAFPKQPLASFPLKVEKSFYHNHLEYTKCVFPVADTSICSIADGFGHESFIIPNDEVNISFKRMKKDNRHTVYTLNGKYISPYFNEFKYEGKNKYIYSLFDSLSYNTGGLFSGGDIGFKEVNHDIKLFFDTVSRQYTSRITYLDSYCRKYTIPKTIRDLAFLEIKADYIGNLLEPLQNIVKDLDYADYPKGYMDTLNTINFDNPQYFKTKVFSQKAFYYLQLYKGRTSLKDKLDDDNSLIRISNTINNNYKNGRIQERLLATLLVTYEKYACPSYDSLLNVYHEKFPGSKYGKYIDSIYYDYRSKAKFSLNDGLASELVDYIGNKSVVKSVLRSRPVIIDCWASWCVPCLQQFPFSAELEKKYAGKIDFVYLSFDRDKYKWTEKSKALSLKNTFLLKDDFKSKFANYFNVISIPQYIILNSTGQVINQNAPRPANKEALEKILKSLVQ